MICCNHIIKNSLLSQTESVKGLYSGKTLDYCVISVSLYAVTHLITVISADKSSALGCDYKIIVIINQSLLLSKEGSDFGSSQNRF